MSGATDASDPVRCAYVVDDDAGFRGSMLMLLESAGWSVQGFASAAAFAECAGELEPGILLLDLHLDGVSGLDFLESRGPALDRFAVLMVTGAGEIETAVRAMKAGAADFVEKPFRADELLERLARIHERFASELC